MPKINFIKMHGLGNDFVIIDKRYQDVAITKDLITKLSDRKSGAGCDQLITINLSEQLKIDAVIKIFNHNGDKAEACGNGARCVAKLLFDKTEKKEISILSDSGILKAVNKDDGNISVNLGKLSTEWEKIPLSEKIDTLDIPIKINGFSNGVAVNIGNPHIVFFGKNIDDVDLAKLGPDIENNKFFPSKTNIEIVEVLSNKIIKMRVWERGVGITLACGSGACASVYAGQLKKLLDNNVEVQLERGSLFIKIEGNEAILTGPEEISFYGRIEI